MSDVEQSPEFSEIAEKILYKQYINNGYRSVGFFGLTVIGLIFAKAFEKNARKFDIAKSTVVLLLSGLLVYSLMALYFAGGGTSILVVMFLICVCIFGLYFLVLYILEKAHAYKSLNYLDLFAALIFAVAEFIFSMSAKNYVTELIHGENIMILEQLNQAQSTA